MKSTQPFGALPPSHLLIDLVAGPSVPRVYSACPNFSWQVNHEHPDEYQCAWQILVASSFESLDLNVADVWDSGRVSWPFSCSVPYGGSALAPLSEYCWKVRVWTRAGDVSPWSEIQSFKTADFYTCAGVPRLEPQTSSVAPVTVEALDSGGWFLDFGQVSFGHLELDGIAGDDKSQIVAHLGENLRGSYDIDRSPPGSVQYCQGHAKFNASRRKLVIAPPAKPGAMIQLPRDVGHVVPFRFAEVLYVPTDWDPRNARQLTVHYPFNDEASAFACSEPVLEDLWRVCKHTIKATSFAGIYVDGDRERKPYEADAYINQLSHYSVDREFTLARASMEYLLNKPSIYTEWLMYVVLMAWTDYLHTNDLCFARRWYATLAERTLHGLGREDGLISSRHGELKQSVRERLRLPAYPPIEDIVDWPPVERDDYDMVPVNTVVNALHYRTLTMMSRLAAALKQSQDAGFFAARATQVRSAINTRLYDPRRKLYVDGEGSDHTSLHANLFPVAFGVVPADRVDPVVDYLVARGMACSPYAAQFLLDALFEANRPDDALAIMTSRSLRSWGHMLYDLDATMTHEAWDGRFKPNQDWNHAWGTAPANIIMRHIIGIQPMEPGFARVRIRPRLGNLESVSARLPTIRGPIEVAVTTSGSAFTVDATLPVNVSATVEPPIENSEHRRIEVDGRDRGKHPDEPVSIGSGRHRVTWYKP